MAAYTPEQLIAVLKKAGWKNEDIPQAYAIVRAESGGDPAKLNRSSSATGLFQIMHSVWSRDADVKKLYGKTPSRNDLTDPLKNAQVGLIVLRKQGWSAWEVIKIPALQEKLAAEKKIGERALAEYRVRYPDGIPGNSIGDTAKKAFEPITDLVTGDKRIPGVSTALDVGSAVREAGGTIADGVFRIGWLVSAIVLVVLGVVVIVLGNKSARNAVSTVVSAAPVGKVAKAAKAGLRSAPAVSKAVK